MNATDKRLRLKFRFVSRDLVPSDRATYTIAFRVNFFDIHKVLDWPSPPSTFFDFEVWDLHVSPAIIFVATNVINTPT